MDNHYLNSLKFVNKANSNQTQAAGFHFTEGDSKSNVQCQANSKPGLTNGDITYNSNSRPYSLSGTFEVGNITLLCNAKNALGDRENAKVFIQVHPKPTESEPASEGSSTGIVHLTP